jgi:hypothetical protein
MPSSVQHNISGAPPSTDAEARHHAAAGIKAHALEHLASHNY